MRKRLIIMCLVGAALALGAAAQTAPVKVESPIVTEKDFVWYTEQKEAWKEVIQKAPHDEEAWQNYYLAARYMAWFNPSDTTARQAISEMQAAIPHTYTFNKCAYRAMMAGHGLEPKGDEYAETALSMMPSSLSYDDYNTWVCYLAMKGQQERMAQLAKRFFDSGLYSETVLRYNYNELAGIDDGGIIIVNGDAAVVPKWLIQEGMAMHRDKTVVCLSFLAVAEYREWLFKKLAIELPSWDSGSYDDYEKILLQAIFDRYDHQVYFSTTVDMKLLEPWKQYLYNEGLTLKYSRKPYDNMTLKRRNVEERYMMEYLLVSFRPDWASGQHLAANYAVVLADLLPYYAKHDRKRFDWLMHLLVSGVSNTSLSDERKQEILQLLMQEPC